MDIEKKFIEYVVNVKYDDIPQKTVDLAKDVTLSVLGAIIGGATATGCPEVVEQTREWGGKEQATILIYGVKVPAYNAAFTNSFMARALAVDDAMLPGIHIGGTSVPTALAVVELVGGCGGKDFLTAIVVGTEVAARINFATVYDGFDPTGVCAVLAAAAIAGKILGLNSEQMWNALGHAFNSSGGSFQGTIDGSVAARVLQGNASQSGIISAQLAQRGITGPRNFLEGVYGYFHLYARDEYNPEAVAGELGKRFEMNKTMLKKYPSCGTTQASIDAIFSLMEEKGVTPEQVAEIKVTVTPFTYNLVGKPFEYGDNPRISAMYSIQYCVANALFRRSCIVRHFDESLVREPKIKELIDKIRVFPEPALDKRNLFATDMEVRMRDGAVYQKTVDFPRGVSENPLTKDEVMDKFRDCISYAGKLLPQKNINRIISIVSELEDVKDVRDLIPLLISQIERGKS